MRELQSRHLLAQVTGSKDRRQRLLHLTDEGRVIAGELAGLQRNVFANAFRNAGPEAVAGFRQVLSGLISEHERAGVMRLIAKK